jgi:hypothetical protein
MLRFANTIILLGLLLSLQYGKITSYLYCEWEAKIVNELADCDCVQMLNGVFDNNDHSVPGIASPQMKLADYLCNDELQQGFAFNPQPVNDQSFYLFYLTSANTEPAIRPPAGC